MSTTVLWEIRSAPNLVVCARSPEPPQRPGYEATHSWSDAHAASWSAGADGRADPRECVAGRGDWGMAFGQQAGPPASRREVQVLLTLLHAAGHTDFRDARGPMGFTQRQAAGKFTRDEAAAFIAQLQETESSSEPAAPRPPNPGYRPPSRCCAACRPSSWQPSCNGAAGSSYSPDPRHSSDGGGSVGRGTRHRSAAVGGRCPSGPRYRLPGGEPGRHGVGRADAR